MCMEDVRIGRLTRHQYRTYTIGTTATRVLQHNPLRWGIIWGNPASGTIWVGIDSTIAAGRGIALTSAAQAPFWNVTLHGDMVTEELWMVGSAAGIVVSLFELELGKD